MKVVALVSGGKDSCFSMHLCGVHGHQVVALANLLPPDNNTDELDSYMYQTVGHQLVAAYAACTGLPLYRRRIRGASTCRGLSYSCTAGDEVEDLTALLAFIKGKHPDVQAVASGAIASDYQRLRVEAVCARLGLVSLGYLWHQPQDQLLSDMIDIGIEAVLVKVAAIGLDPHKHLGKSIRQMQPLLRSLRDRFGCNVCGEGGEYETLTLDCPAFHRGRIVLDDWGVVLHSPDSIAPVGVLHPVGFHVEHKQPAAAGTATADGSQQRPKQQQQQQQQQPAAVVVEVPDDWQPAAVTAAAAAVPASAAADSAVQPGDTWSAVVQVTVSRHHIHLTCKTSSELHLNTAAAAAADGGAASGSSLTAADTAAAVDAALSAVAEQLPRHGLTWLAACFVHLYLADMAHFSAANEVYCRHLPQVDPPSRACVQVPLPAGCPVLLDVLFARPPVQQQQQLPLDRRVLHVQSISSWAPSCIGPYSQATTYNGLIYMAGQIPLEPATMAIAEPSPAGLQHTIAAQTWRALCSCQAVAVAVRSCFAGASLGLTVYLAETAAVAGGQAVVQAALQAAWADRSLLECLKVPPAVRRAAADAAAGAAGAAAAHDAAGSAGAPDTTTCGSCSTDRQQRWEQEQEADGSESEQGAGFVDDYLKPPAVASPVRPTVIYVTVPALPRGALLEVQPVLADLSAPPRAAASTSSSSGDDSDGACEQEAARAGTAAHVPHGAADCCGSGAAAAIGVHVTQDACQSSGWWRVLVHMAGQHGGDGAGCGSADDQRAAQVLVAAEQIAAGNQRCGGAAASVCSLRCWYVDNDPAGGSQSKAAWQASLVSSLQDCTGQQDLALQLVQVSTVATSVQLEPCWAVIEVYGGPWDGLDRE